MGEDFVMDNLISRSNSDLRTLSGNLISKGRMGDFIR
jgi:hypothetical protein